MSKVLVAVSDESCASTVLSVLRSMDRKPDEVLVVQVRPLLSGSHAAPSSVEDREDALAGYRAAIGTRGQVRVHVLLKTGDPSDEILKAAREERVDLIIIGGGRRVRLRKMFRGGMIKDVEQKATVPVLVATTAGRKSMKEGEAYVAA